MRATTYLGMVDTMNMVMNGGRLNVLTYPHDGTWMYMTYNILVIWRISTWWKCPQLFEFTRGSSISIGKFLLDLLMLVVKIRGISRFSQLQNGEFIDMRIINHKSSGCSPPTPDTVRRPIRIVSLHSTHHFMTIKFWANLWRTKTRDTHDIPNPTRSFAMKYLHCICMQYMYMYLYIYIDVIHDMMSPLYLHLSYCDAQANDSHDIPDDFLHHLYGQMSDGRLQPWGTIEGEAAPAMLQRVLGQ